MRAARSAWRAAALLTCLWAAPLWAKDEPTIHSKKFENPIRNLNYFEDSDVILFQDVEAGKIWRSPDAGTTWDGIKDIPDGEAARLIMHEFDSNRAYILTESATHWRTEDRGKSWTKFSSGSVPSAFQFELMMFHANDPDRIIFNGMDCQSIFCEDVTMYTIDGFKTEAKVLRANTGGCWWAASSGLFTTGEDDLDKQRILCVVRDSFSPFKQDQRLLISDNYFKGVHGKKEIQEFEPNLDGDRAVQGVVNIAVVKKYILVATTSTNTDEMALFVTDDTKKWHRAVFPTDHKLNQEAYTVLESTNYSIQVDVMDTRPSNPMGVMFTSNSNGTYFTRNIEFTNRNKRGHVDFEKISGIQGIFLVNTVENGKDVLAKQGVEKTVISEISFDDGRTFAEIKTAEGERLHVHSVTELDNIGRVFSSPAPGLVMANGNIGKHLKAFKEASLFISDDAGVSWIKGPEGPHKYEFGDQGSILIAVKDAESIDEITYSLDHGKTWATTKLPDGLKVKPFILTTTQDSTSLKFMLIGTEGDAYHAISIDFEGLHEATCKDSDLEDWWARVDKDGKPTCLMGHKQKYHRRKKDAKCFLKQEFKDPVVETEDCECTDADFECDFNFKREGSECKKVGPYIVPEGACKDDKPDATFKGSSGWRLIPGNTCRRKSGEQKDDPTERKCAESEAPGKKPTPMTGEVANKVFKFPGDYDNFDKYYLERGESSEGDDETIIARPVDLKAGNGGKIHITHDHGKNWKIPDALEKESIWGVIPHPHFKEVVYFITTGEKVIYTIDKGQHFHEFKAPYPPDTKRMQKPLAFHPDKKDWLIWVGEKCESKSMCYPEASFSNDRGDNWRTLRRYVSRCEFIGSTAYKSLKDRKLEEILCLARTREDNEANNPYQLVSSSDFFDTPKIVQENVREFATMSEFIVVAAQDPKKETLRAMASLDGENYADAHFPYGFDVPHQHAYTVLDSSTHAVNLFVVTQEKDNHRYGSILRSNSNGTSYVMSIQGVNCNDEYFVDFEKMLGLEGIIVVNIVANRDDQNGKKQLQSKISHNDGAEWAYLSPPAQDIDGKSYSCSSGAGDERCALHIHGYTEREDRRKTYSSEGAVGLMFALGHVGSHLGEYKEADTFMTTDAGLSWKNVKKGVWTWQFGDMGSIIVLVQRHTKTKTVSYTTDEGKTWKDHEFHDSEVEVVDLTTLRSGASRNFVVWCKSGGEVFSVNLDFSGLTDRACVQDKEDPNSSKSDYYLWSPTHPLMPDKKCLFGHESQYLRKKADRTCYNGVKLEHLYNMKNCTCTRRDYECDFNYELDNVNECSLVPGLKPQSKEEWCAEHPDESDYYPDARFRRIPLTTCEGGQQFDQLGTPEPCKGHEDEFERKHSGPGGFVIFLAVVVPFAFAAAVGWWVYNNWSGKFGAIRLGENGSAGGGGFNIDSDSPFVKYPVIALSATFAVIGALPLIASALWRTATTAAERWGFGSGGDGRGGWSALGGGTRTYRTRDSFARGRGGDAYDIVDEDEGELLGDESDEEV